MKSENFLATHTSFPSHTHWLITKGKGAAICVVDRLKMLRYKARASTIQVFYSKLLGSKTMKGQMKSTFRWVHHHARLPKQCPKHTIVSSIFSDLIIIINHGRRQHCRAAKLQLYVLIFKINIFSPYTTYIQSLLVMLNAAAGAAGAPTLSQYWYS